MKSEGSLQFRVLLPTCALLLIAPAALAQHGGRGTVGGHVSVGGQGGGHAAGAIGTAHAGGVAHVAAPAHVGSIPRGATIGVQGGRIILVPGAGAGEHVAARAAVSGLPGSSRFAPLPSPETFYPRRIFLPLNSRTSTQPHRGSSVFTNSVAPTRAAGVASTNVAVATSVPSLFRVSPVLAHPPLNPLRHTVFFAGCSLFPADGFFFFLSRRRFIFGTGFGFPSFCTFNGFEHVCFVEPFATPAFSPSFFPFGLFGVPFGGVFEPQPSEEKPQAGEGVLAPETQPPAGAQPVEKPLVLLVLKDGTVYAIADYWLEDGRLYYVTSYGARNSLPLEQIDLEKTAQENWKRGIEFVLRPKPTTP